MGNGLLVTRRTILLFLLPSMAGLLVFYLVPLGASFLLSLTRWDGLTRLGGSGGLPPIIGLDNYARVLSSAEFWQVLGNTTYFIALYLPGMLAGSLAVALLLSRDVRGIGIFRVIYYIPVLTSWVAGALVWRWLLSPRYGPVNAVITALGLPAPGWLYDPAWAMPAVVLASVWKDVGFFGLIFLGGLQSIDGSLYEAAEIDGAGAWYRFRRITLPLLSPVTFFITVVALINSFQLFPQIMVMTDNAGPQGATRVLLERIYTYAFRYYEMGFASAYSWVLFAVIFLLTALQFRAQKTWVHYES